MPSPRTAEQPRFREVRARAFATWGQVPRFVRNAVISVPTFLVDLGLLFLLIRACHVNYLFATVVGFFIANGLGYFLARRLVFVETNRGVRSGLVYFLVIAALSAFALTPLMWLSVSAFHIDVIVSRILASSIVGAGGYVLNLILNFRVGRSHVGALR